MNNYESDMGESSWRLVCKMLSFILFLFSCKTNNGIFVGKG